MRGQGEHLLGQDVVYQRDADLERVRHRQPVRERQDVVGQVGLVVEVERRRETLRRARVPVKTPEALLSRVARDRLAQRRSIERPSQQVGCAAQEAEVALRRAPERVTRCPVAGMEKPLHAVDRELAASGAGKQVAEGRGRCPQRPRQAVVVLRRQHSRVPAVPAEQLVPPDAGESDLVPAADDLREGPRRDRGVVGVRLIQRVHDRLEHVPDLRADVNDRERDTVAPGQEASQLRLVGGRGPRTVVAGGEGVRDLLRTAGDRCYTRDDGRRVQATRQKRGDGNVAHQVCGDRCVDPFHDPLLDVGRCGDRPLR